MKNKSYTVIWEIDIFAKTPEAAVKEALEIQRDPDSAATVFKVYNNDDEYLIDVEEL